jgi:DNA repair exonuclease SbcCD nuclease subunit
MKFVHAADIHLDSPLCGLERYEGAPAERLRGATRGALRNLVRLCLDEEVSFLLVAGDLYDGDWRDYNTGLFFAKEIARLTREGIAVVIARGNHDAASQITRNLRLPEGVFELSTERAETLRLNDLNVAIHARSYAERDVFEDLSAQYPHALGDAFNIGMLHTALDGREGHQRYAPCRLDALLSKGYQYWALGHVHRREVLSTEPWALFCGNLQGRHARESGPKGATLVTVEGARVASAEHRALDVVRWACLSVDVSEAASGDDVVDLVRSKLEAEAAAGGERMLAVRISVAGVSRAYSDLARDPERWQNQIRALASELAETVWVERVLFNTRSTVDSASLLTRDDPVGALVRSIRASRSDSTLLRQLGGEMEELRRQLPAELRQLEEPLDLADPEQLAAFIDEAEQLLLPRLLSSGS